MHISLSPKEASSLRRLFDSLAWNIDISDFVNEELLNGSPLSEGPIYDFLEEMEMGQSKILPAALTGYEEEGLQGHLPKMACLDIKDYEEDPLLKAYKGATYKKGDLILQETVLPAYTPFLYDEITGNRRKFYAENMPIGFFKDDYSYTEIKRHGVTWMSFLPHEINTMRPFVNKARGRVLVYGLGLGYVAGLLAAKPEVAEVTVVELDHDIIHLYEEVLRPLTPNQEKIHIEEADAFAYEPKGHYDIAFVDLYHNEEDGLPIYLKMLSREHGIPTDYWIEKSLLTYFRRLVMEYLSEEAEGFTPEGEGPFEGIFKKLKEALREKRFTSYKSLEDFLEDENLYRLIRAL